MPLFDHDDDHYLAWLRSHPNGFLLNVQRTHNRYGLMLHRTSCHTIQSDGYRKGGWTTGDYVKVCSDGREELEEWALHEVGIPPPHCSKCAP
jgi:hypothetical protein